MKKCEDIILKLEGVSKSFSGVNVLKDISLNLKKGEILGIVGENGAGKSTLMNIIGGVLPKDNGTIYLDNKNYDPTNPTVAKNSGIAFIHQELILFLNLSITENMFIDDFPKVGVLRKIDYKKIKSIARHYIEILGIELNPETLVESLSMGQRQLVEVAKALNKQASIIIFDEPTTSLSTREKENLFRVINELRAKGTSIIYISHIIKDVFSLCDSILILRDGQVIGQDEVGNLTKEKVVKMMVGRELSHMYPSLDKGIGDVVFEVKNIYQNYKLKNINISLREGEIVGLFGIMGTGRTELARVIFGIDKMDSGEIYYHGKREFRITPTNSINHGMAFITENRRYEGLLMPKSVNDNLVCAYLNHLVSGIFQVIDRRKENDSAKKAVSEIGIKTYNKDKQPVKNLSGGNQQRVVIGKWLMLEPKIIILDEPTKGVDVGAKYEIYNIINNMAKNKATVLFISSEMEELMGMCDRILVMRKGEIIKDFCKGEYNQEEIIKLAIEVGD